MLLSVLCPSFVRKEEFLPSKHLVMHVLSHCQIVVASFAWEAVFADTGTPLLIPLFPLLSFSPLFLDLFLSRLTMDVQCIFNSAIILRAKALSKTSR